jgi:hypothetical protein
MFRIHVEKGTPLVPDLRPAVFEAVARSNNPTAIEQLKHIFETVNFSEVTLF